MFDYLVVGAGFAGSIIAERLASQLNKKVLVVDKRNHIAGNAYDFYDNEGVLVHKYGPHIFHTNSKKVFDYLSQFTQWRLYEHRVLASVDGQLVPMPINLKTINMIFGLSLSNDEVEGFLNSRKIEVEEIINSRDIIISRIGVELYEKFFKGYTKKQWGVFPEELDSSVCARIPIRTNSDSRYFGDTYQAMPKFGYTRMFENILNHRNISVLLQTDFKAIMDQVRFDKVIYTGPVDLYFNHCYNALPYRSLSFEFETIDKEFVQEVGTINYPNSYDFTRITEIKHITGQKHPKTSIIKEFPTVDGDPYYPIPQPENNLLYQRYKEKAEKEKNVHFLGRLGTYKYYNMDQVVAQALTLFEKIAKGE